MSQLGTPRPQYEKRGEREAARQLGLDRDDVRRAIKVVALFLAGQRWGCYNLG